MAIRSGCQRDRRANPLETCWSTDSESVFHSVAAAGRPHRLRDVIGLRRRVGPWRSVASHRPGVHARCRRRRMLHGGHRVAHDGQPCCHTVSRACSPVWTCLICRAFLVIPSPCAAPRWRRSPGKADVPGATVSGRAADWSIPHRHAAMSSSPGSARPVRCAGFARPAGSGGAGRRMSPVSDPRPAARGDTSRGGVWRPRRASPCRAPWRRWCP